MAIDEAERTEQQGDGADPHGVCLCVTYLRATERAALAGARWLGRDDQESAEESAYSGMHAALETLPMSGRVVLGDGELPRDDRRRRRRPPTSRSTRSRAAASSRAAGTARSR